MFRLLGEQADVFDSSEGPDGGNLACVWVVRHLANKALNRWITRTDSTTEFDQELRRCYTPSESHENIAAGGRWGESKSEQYEQLFLLRTSCGSIPVGHRG